MIKYYNSKNRSNEARARLFKAKFLESGLVGYANSKGTQDVILVKDNTIEKMADSFRGCPVIVNHDADITEENFVNKAKGFVTRVTKEEDGWYCEFTLHNKQAIQDYEENGYNFVSCAYMETEAGEGGTLHNIAYKEEVLDGYFTHLALTKNPRYEDAKIFANSIDESKGEKSMFTIFKKVENELDNSVLIETKRGAVSLEELVKHYENSIEEPVEEVKEEPATEEVKEEVVEETEKENAVETIEETKEETEIVEEKEEVKEEISSETEPLKEEVLEEKTEGKEPEVKENSVENHFAELENARANSVEDEKEPVEVLDGFKVGKELY